MMFLNLFSKECKAVIKSIIYYIFIGCIIIFYAAQLGDFEALSEPVKGSENYGLAISTDKDTIMRETLDELLFQYDRNSYPTYPIGFYKEVILNEKKQEKVAEYIEELTGANKTQIREKLDAYYNGQVPVETEEGGTVVQETVKLDLNILSTVSYEKFLDIMDKIDDLLGGGSSFKRSNVEAGVKVDMTYEQALQEYKDIVEKDRVTSAYARLFCDYMGIMLGILPVFLAIARQLRDKRAKVVEVIYSKAIPAYKIILSRFLANALMVLIPLLLIGLVPYSQSVYQAEYLGASADLLAFVKYTLGWLMPTVLFTLAVGFLFTELSNSVLAALLQGICWFTAIFSATNNLVGHVGMNLIPRFNKLGGYDIYKNIYPDLIKNRIGYTVISVLLLFLTILIYSIKREGGVIKHGKAAADLESKH